MRNKINKILHILILICFATLVFILAIEPREMGIDNELTLPILFSLLIITMTKIILKDDDSESVKNNKKIDTSIIIGLLSVTFIAYIFYTALFLTLLYYGGSEWLIVGIIYMVIGIVGSIITTWKLSKIHPKNKYINIFLYIISNLITPTLFIVSQTIQNIF